MTHPSGGVVEGWQSVDSAACLERLVEFLLDFGREFSGKICRADAPFDGQAELVQLRRAWKAKWSAVELSLTAAVLLRQ